MNTTNVLKKDFERMCLYMSQNFPEPIIMALGFGDGYLYYGVN